MILRTILSIAALLAGFAVIATIACGSNDSASPSAPSTNMSALSMTVAGDSDSYSKSDDGKSKDGRSRDGTEDNFSNDNKSNDGSKSNDGKIARAVVELKSLVDRIKEQVQNAE